MTAVNIHEQELRTLVRSSVGRAMGKEFHLKAMPVRSGECGVYRNMNDAVEAAHRAFLEFQGFDLQDRKKIIDTVRQLTIEHKEEFSRMAVEQTGMGRVDHKIIKHINTAEHTPGVEFLQPEAWSGKNGMAFDEYAPWGVIGNITPSTHPSAAMLNNIIMQAAAGNAIAFNPHPVSKRLSAHVIQLCNKHMTEAGAPENLVTCVADPTLETAEVLFSHEKTRLLSITGGPEVVKAAMKHGKPTVAAGPGNPPVLIDETADLRLAASEITVSAAFDNNILCIAEKTIFVVESVFSIFIEQMTACGNMKLTPVQMNSLGVRALLREGGHFITARNCVGKSAAELAGILGIPCGDDVPLLFGETDCRSAWVIAEQMTSCIPVVRVRSFEEGVQRCVEAEHGFEHTASIFTRDMNRASFFSKKLNTDIIVINGGTLRGNGGNSGEGYFSHTIASPTGEGITTPRDFSRKRRIMAGGLRFV
jgi:acyl-CoA reductase-like NAD-dependent aldehyde dehydrogenase